MTQAIGVDEIHIASCVAFTLPQRQDAIALAIDASGRAEVAGRDSTGRLVVIIEGRTSREVVDAMDLVRVLPGVIALHLVYQHCEKACAFEETP